MKVYKVVAKDWFGNYLKDIAVVPKGNRLYKNARNFDLLAYTDEGVFKLSIGEGVIINYRSGGIGVDPFIDQIGSTMEQQAAWWFHDLNYTPCASLGMEHPVSKELADELLKAMLIYSGMPSWKANIVYYSVKLFGKSAYEEDDELTKVNSHLFSFTWEAK